MKWEESNKKKLKQNEFKWLVNLIPIIKRKLKAIVSQPWSNKAPKGEEALIFQAYLPSKASKV